MFSFIEKVRLKVIHVVGQHDFIIKASFNDLNYLNTSSLPFSVMMLDPCVTATISIDPGILPSLLLEYTIDSSGTLFSIKLDQSKVQSDVPAATCPAL